MHKNGEYGGRGGGAGERGRGGKGAQMGGDCICGGTSRCKGHFHICSGKTHVNRPSVMRCRNWDKIQSHLFFAQAQARRGEVRTRSRSATCYVSFFQQTTRKYSPSWATTLSLSLSTCASYKIHVPSSFVQLVFAFRRLISLRKKTIQI